MKKTILTIVLTAIIVGSIGVYAGTKISATEVGYRDKDNNEITVQAALNDIYDSLTGNAQLISYSGPINSGTEIDVKIGDYVILSSVAGTTATNAELVGSMSGGYWNKVSGYVGIWRATSTKMVIGTDSGNTLSYVVIR